MPKRALVEKRPWLLASLAAAFAWYGLRTGQFPEPYLIALKGAGVALLAVYALLRHQGADSRMIAAVMAISAMGDMAMELSTGIGGALFFAAHLVAIALYWRHRRESLTSSQRLAAAALLLLTPAIAGSLVHDPAVFAYALALGGMACAAWSSNFPRYRVGVGAVLFVASDLLIFARMGPLAASPLPDLLIWPLYYFGQFLIATGVVGELRSRQSAA